MCLYLLHLGGPCRVRRSHGRGVEAISIVSQGEQDAIVVTIVSSSTVGTATTRRDQVWVVAQLLEPANQLKRALVHTRPEVFGLSLLVAWQRGDSRRFGNNTKCAPTCRSPRGERARY
jgi:hypothetical protein